MVLIDWIDQLHASPSVNIIRCMPRFLTKFLQVIETQEGDHGLDLGKKALAQLNHFLEDLKDPRYRNLNLDREVIRKLTEFLMKCDDSKKIALYCSLDWLSNFIIFLGEDFSALIKMLQVKQLGQQEESKEADQSKRGVVLEENSAALLKLLYKEEFPDIISTILRLKHSKRIDPRCKIVVENMNGRFLKTVIQILNEKNEFETIFKRLKKEYAQDQATSNGEKQETIIQWYIELFKTFPDLIDMH